jgi:hypothetical protein
MDIANYLSELLGQHGEISVPGLGYFVHVRVSAQYNEAERKFYPPGFKIQFEPQPVEGDDVLTNYIAEKKKISLASSKYFTDKYITSLKQEASLQEVPFADLGWFFMDKGRVAFKSRVSNTGNADFYGYEPISIKKLNQTAEPEKPVVVPATAPSVPVVALAPDTLPVETPAVVPAYEPLPLPPPIRSAAQTVDQPEQYYDDEPEHKRGLSIWAIVLIVLVVLAGAAFAVYKFKPELLHLNKGEQMQLPAEQPKTVVKKDTDTVKKVVTTPKDTAKAISKPDSALNKSTPVVDATPKTEFAIFVGSFKTASKSALFIKDLKKRGVDAQILTGPGTGPRIKVIIGGFATSADAEAKKTELINAKKIDKGSYSQQITNPQK